MEGSVEYQPDQRAPILEEFDSSQTAPSETKLFRCAPPPLRMHCPVRPAVPTYVVPRLRALDCESGSNPVQYGHNNAQTWSLGRETEGKISVQDRGIFKEEPQSVLSEKLLYQCSLQWLVPPPLHRINPEPAVHTTCYSHTQPAPPDPALNVTQHSVHNMVFLQSRATATTSEMEVFKEDERGRGTSVASRKAVDLKNSRNAVTRMYPCNKCGTIWNHLRDLRAHERIHIGIGDRRYPADTGEGEFSNPAAVLHLRGRTAEEQRRKVYKCTFCGKFYKSPKALLEHERSHTGERPYQCDKCEKAFYTRETLNSHLRIHSGERPFVCEMCGKAYTRKDHLVVHVRTHTGEKPYRCPTCGKTFASTENLALHRRVHTGERPYQCDVCGRSFRQNPHLVVHRRSHTDERPYPCNKCEKAFSTHHSLIIHTRTHTGEKPYQCKRCGKRFNQRPNMNTHVKTCKAAPHAQHAFHEDYPSN